jgi:hypothetical protein
MKIIKKESASLLVEFTTQETIILNQIINVPLHGYIIDEYKSSFEKLLPIMGKVNEKLNSAGAFPKCDISSADETAS